MQQTWPKFEPGHPARESLLVKRSTELSQPPTMDSRLNATSLFSVLSS